MAKIAVISNVNSKKNLLNPNLIQTLTEILGDKGRHIVTKSVEEIPGAVRRLIEEGVEVVAVNSGDGGLNYIATEFIRSLRGSRPPLFLPLNGGTANVLSKSLGLKLPPEKILDRLMQYADRPAAEIPRLGRRSLIQSFPDHPGKPSLNGFMVTGGVIYNFFSEYDKYPIKGFFTYVKLICAVSIGSFYGSPLFRRVFRRDWLDLTIDGDTRKNEPTVGYMIGCENFSIFGLRPFSPSKNGGFNFVKENAHHLIVLVKMLLTFLGVKPSGRGTVNLEATRIRLSPTTPDGENNFNIDGENVSWRGSYEIVPGPVVDFADVIGGK